MGSRATGNPPDKAGGLLVSGQVMSHIRPEPKPSKHRIADCRKGSHDYAEGQHIGAGIVRRVCQTCAYVTIDLSGAEAISSPGLQAASELTSAKQ